MTILGSGFTFFGDHVHVLI